ncbi:hypothetical protein QF038_001808 [Pseudarthrobacter sp. W1I19]|uniref:hypothetical protein n=1 Tax=Pseudarthrobacter sp. W1I19 TaxID=3042288 RepID=UPI0027867281|nr:hypothetical protein [Pseudarthrobacter sp. W1I19]MDQ0923300.1 hypothetical protein [Pseudarthrobacter sp. W1I19]
MPEFEYIVGFTPQGSRKKLYVRGIVYVRSNSELLARERAIQKVSERYGFNLKDEYTCVVVPVPESEEA